MTLDPLSLVFYFSLAGTLFAGYRTIVRLATKTCAFGETCPNVFGVPACIIGSLFFLAIFISSAGMRFSFLSPELAVPGMFWGALLGLVYSGTLSLSELFFEIRKKKPLILSSCACGFLLFAVIFVLLAFS